MVARCTDEVHEPWGRASAAQRRRSGAAGAGVEALAVQVHVKLDRADPAGRPPDEPAKRGKTPFARALLPRVADVMVRAVFGLPDPLTRGLRRGRVGAEGVPAARGPPAQPGARDPVQARAAQRSRRALATPDA